VSEVSAASVLLVFLLLVAAVVAGIVTARQARRLPSVGTPSVTTRGSGPTEPVGDGSVLRQRPRRTVDRHPESPVPGAPSELTEDADEEDATYRAVTAALEAHAKRADRKALYSNILFFAAGVLASILTTLLVHPL
jgi:hypothetical protein